MQRGPKGIGATGGSPTALAAHISHTLLEFNDERDRLLQAGLYGRRLRRSFTRDAMLRILIYELHHHRVPALTEIQDRLKHLASKSTVRAEVGLMKSCDVVVLEPVSGRPTARGVRLTQRAVDFFNTYMVTKSCYMGKAMGALRAQLK